MASLHILFGLENEFYNKNFIKKYYTGFYEEMLHHEDEVLVGMLTSVRCSAHTLQLAAFDAIKHENIKSNIDKIRNIIRIMRSVAHKEYFICNPNKKPILDVITRWSSTYQMLLCLAENKSFYEVFFQNNPSIDFNLSDWIFVEKFCEAYKPIYIATKELQESNLVIGDFYKVWLNCKIRLDALQQNAYAQTLSGCMGVREKKMLNNNHFLAGIFLDPRFNFLGTSHITNEEKAKAKVSKILLKNNKN